MLGAGRRGHLVLGGAPRRRLHARRAGRPRHAPARGRPAAPRPRAGPRHHAAAGRPRAGSSPGTRATSWAGRRWRPSGPAASTAGCVGSRSRAASRPGPGSRSWTATARSGEVTSGNFSPMLDRGIALAFLPPARRPGDRVAVDVRGDAIAGAASSSRPFVKKTVHGEPGAHFVPHTDAEIGDDARRRSGCRRSTSCSPCVPEALRLAGGLDLRAGPERGRHPRRGGRLAAANRPAGRDLVCFAGGGAYDHDVPSAVRRSPSAPSSSPPTRRTSPRWPRACSRRCSSTRRWCAG